MEVQCDVIDIFHFRQYTLLAIYKNLITNKSRIIWQPCLISPDIRILVDITGACDSVVTRTGPSLPLYLPITPPSTPPRRQRDLGRTNPIGRSCRQQIPVRSRMGLSAEFQMAPPDGHVDQKIGYLGILGRASRLSWIYLLSNFYILQATYTAENEIYL